MTAGLALRAATWAAAYNTLLTLVKLAVGWSTGSVAVLSEAANSGFDLLASLLAVAAVRFASRPADRTHPFGHGKAHHVAALFEGLIILGTAAVLAVEAVQALLHGAGPHATGPGMVVMGLTAAGNVVVAGHLRRVARLTGAPVLEADAVHLLTDVWSSGGVLVALLLVRVTGVPQLDAAAALAVVAVIAVSGWRVAANAVAALLDASLPEREQRVVREVAARHADRVVELHDLRTRRVGNERQIDFHLVVHRRLPFAEVHALCDRLEAEIRARLPGAHVLIHPEPCEPACPQCATRPGQ